MVASKSKAPGKPNNGANLGFEQKLWAAADKLRGHMNAADYKHVVLGLIFLKYISDAFRERYEALKKEAHADPEDRDEYTAENVFRVPKAARWSHLQDSAKQPTIGKLINDAMDAIEKANPSLKSVLPKDYNRPGLDKHRLGELIDRGGHRPDRQHLPRLARRKRHWQVRGRARFLQKRHDRRNRSAWLHPHAGTLCRRGGGRG